MLPALPNPKPGDPPRDVVCRAYSSIQDVAPVLVRRTAQDIWYDTRDPAIAAEEAFEETDGIHSFYEIRSVSDLAAVGAFMSSQRDKPYRKAVYFCAVTGDLIERFNLRIEPAQADGSRCPAMHAMHRHVTIEEGQRLRLFQQIQDAKLFNFRVDRSALTATHEALKAQQCLDHHGGACLHCHATRQTSNA
jgi:hypothetical protein